MKKKVTLLDNFFYFFYKESTIQHTHWKTWKPVHENVIRYQLVKIILFSKLWTISLWNQFYQEKTFYIRIVRNYINNIDHQWSTQYSFSSFFFGGFIRYIFHYIGCWCKFSFENFSFYVKIFASTKKRQRNNNDIAMTLKNDNTSKNPWVNIPGLCSGFRFQLRGILEHHSIAILHWISFSLYEMKFLWKNCVVVRTQLMM